MHSYVMSIYYGAGTTSDASDSELKGTLCLLSGTHSIMITGKAEAVIMPFTVCSFCNFSLIRFLSNL